MLSSAKHLILAVKECLPCDDSYTESTNLIGMLNTKCYYVYILTNQQRTVLYTGVTNDLKQRIQEHYSQQGQKTCFTGKYHAYYLLYFEPHQYINNSIAREKEIKGWVRQKKMKLINET